MKVEFGWKETEFPIRDFELLERHSEEVVIDGDKRKVVIVEPDDFLLEELENRGIRYEVVG